MRLFAKVMCGDNDVADQLVATCLVEARSRLSPSPEGQSLFVELLIILAELIGERGTAPRVRTTAVRADAISLLSQLPPYHRDVLITVNLFGLRYWEAATVCKCPIGTIKSRLNRAKATLSTTLSTGSSEQSAAAINRPLNMRHLAMQSR